MEKFQFTHTKIAGLTEIRPFYADDHRGYLSKVYEKEIFAANGIPIQPWEELCSLSKKGVLRGLHFQREHSQDKLVRVLCGSAWDVAVDLRKGSPTFGAWEGFLLTGENRKMVYLPKGFAHGFLALEEGTLFNYLCGDRYDPDSDGGILWNDPDLAVAWPLEAGQTPILTPKDSEFPTLAQFVKTYGGLKS